MNWFKKAQQLELFDKDEQNNVNLPEQDDEQEKRLTVPINNTIQENTQDKNGYWNYTESAVEDFYFSADSNILPELVDGFNNSKPGERQPWRLAPFPRVKKIWTDYARMNFVRDEKGINLIADILIENIKKIYINTVLAGHTSTNPRLMLEDMGLSLNETRQHDYGDWIMDDTGAWRISDYALGDLINGCLELMSAKTPEEKLQKIDFLFLVSHRRSDIASWLVEGGSRALDELQTQTI